MNYCCNVLNLLAWSIEGITQKTFIDILSCYLCKDGDKKNECCNINQTILRCQLLMAYMYSQHWFTSVGSLIYYPPSCFRLQQTCMTMQGDMDRLRRTTEVRGQFYLYMYQSLSYSVAYIE